MMSFFLRIVVRSLNRAVLFILLKCFDFYLEFSLYLICHLFIIQSMAAPLGTPEDNKNLYFMKQTVGNACGTVGIVHCLANNKHVIPLQGECVCSVVY